MKKYPFKFLDAYEREDTALFFGRDEEIAALYEMVFQSPILLVYGASGTGKTSLIQCGLAGKFQSHDWLALTIRRGNNINTFFEKTLEDAGGKITTDNDMEWLKDVMDEKEPTSITKTLSPLARSFKAIYQKSFRPLYLIFDQFEELFILGSKAEQQQFIETVKEILQMEQPVKMIFSIREEYLGHLSSFERAVPQLLRKKLRVEPMNQDKVRQVILGATSYENSNVRLQPEETDLITEGIFDKIKGEDKSLTIQLPYLQVFLDKFYLEITKDETRKAEAIFTNEALRKIGDIGDILRNFLEEQVEGISQKQSLVYPGTTAATVWSILSPFATLEGTKEPITKENLYDRLPGLDPNLINATVDAFINSRILRFTEDSALYEIAHDSLAKRIAEKRSDEEIALLEIKRLVKSQASMKAEARELFSEKQLNFIGPFQEKLKLTPEEKNLIDQSYQAVAGQKAAEKEQQKRENLRLKERQQLLEKNQRTQKRFIRWIGVALILMIGLAIWAIIQKRAAENAEDENQTQLAKNYWKNYQTSRGENRFTEALLFTAEGINTSKDKDLTKNMFSDIEAFLPQYSLLNILKHNGTVYNVVFSPDGNQIITVSSDSTARIWDPITGKQTVPDLKHDGPVLSAVFSPNGKQVITASADSTARIWEVSTGRQIGPDLKHKGSVASAVFSPDGKRVLTASSDSSARIWEISLVKKTPLVLMHHGIVLSAAFSPDGKKVCTSSDDYTARIWDAVSGKKISPNLLHNGSVYSAVFSSDGKWILTASDDQTARIWDVVSGKQKGPDMKHDGPVFSAVFSPDGKQVLTTSDDKMARIWNLATGKQVGPDLMHDGAVYHAVFSSDGKWILTSSDDQTARIWDAVSGKQISPDLKHDGTVYSAVFFPDGKKVVTVSDDQTIRIWMVSKARQLGLDYKHDGPINSAVFSPDGKQVLTASEDKTVRIWDDVSGKQIGPDLKHKGSVSSAVFSQDGKRVLTASYDKTARIWNAVTGKQIGPDLKHGGVVYSAFFSPDGKQVLTASEDKTVRIWDPVTGKQTVPKLTLNGPVYSAVFSPDGKQMVTSGDDKTARIWDVQTGKQIGPNLKHNGPVYSAVFSSDGKQVLTASADKTARIWDARTGKQMGPGFKHDGPVSSAIFSSDGKQILTASYDKKARIWEIATGKQVGYGLKHEDIIYSAVFSQDGKRVLTASADKTAHIWSFGTDMDIGEDLFKLQAQASTGWKLNIVNNKIESIPSAKWYKLKDEYLKKASEHYKVCKYREYNFWARFYPEEAALIRGKE